MNIQRPHLIALGFIGLVIIAAIAIFVVRHDVMPPQEKRTSNKTLQKVSTPSVPQAQVAAQQLMQNGLYTVDYKDYESATLAQRYSFIAQSLTPEEAPDSPGFMLDPQMPKYIRVAEITIPSKQLTLVAIYTDSMGFCSGKYCLFNLYIKRPQGYENYMGLTTTGQSYVMVDDKSVSIIVCSDIKPSYQQWRLEDGALEKPIPKNSPGHFVPVGDFKHDKIATCP